MIRHRLSGQAVPTAGIHPKALQDHVSSARNDSDLSPQSLLLPLMDGSAGYAGHTMIDLFSRFRASILRQL